MTKIITNKPKPFLKWAGGKTQLLPIIDKNLPRPQIENGQITKFIEPFVGSGAVLFHILGNYQTIKEAYIYDINPELINVYIAIKNNLDELIKILKVLEEDYLPLDMEKRKEKYYDIRQKFNEEIDTLNENDLNIGNAYSKRAAQFIFLNKTCFNGLFRVNKKGEFNVPMGKYKNPTICNKPVLEIASKYLQNVNIKCGDYKQSYQVIDNKTFVYFDPPYKPLSTSSSFTSYSKFDFNDDDQKELALYFHKLNEEKNAFLMLSNSDPKNTDPSNTFFEDIYKNSHINIQSVNARRSINSNANKRGEITELLITNYK